MFVIIKPQYKPLTSPISSFKVVGLKTEPIHIPKSYPETDGCLEPNAIAQRSINRIKYFFQYPESATKERLDTLWSEVKYLEKTLDKQHLIEELCAMYIAAAFFQDEKMQRKTQRLLYTRMKNTNLEESVLELLLDCINIGERMGVNGQRIRDYVKPLLPESGPIRDYAKRLYIRGWLIRDYWSPSLYLCKRLLWPNRFPEKGFILVL